MRSNRIMNIEDTINEGFLCVENEITKIIDKNHMDTLIVPPDAYNSS